jgi:signal transduction histidine kinase
MVVKAKNELMKSWIQTKHNLIFFLFVSVCTILLVTMGTATVLVHKIYVADQHRALSLQKIGHNEKMASIGRLAANVSHEINNPLAIINEKAGLIKDMFEIKKIYSHDPKLTGSVDSILKAVQRASKITRRLLSFARNMEASSETIDLESLIREVLVFLEKEAELKAIEIRLNADGNIAEIKSDRGKLQQIFVNIINNAFDAMDNRGILTVDISKASPTELSVKITDTGGGIAEDDLEQIFEPFFSTKTAQGGTGLGLVVTYNLVREIGGRIRVDSKEGVGTSFTVTIPVKPQSTEVSPHARTTGR